MPLTYVPQNVNTQRNTFSNASCVDDRRSLSVAQRVVQRAEGEKKDSNRASDCFDKKEFYKQLQYAEDDSVTFEDRNINIKYGNNRCTVSLFVGSDVNKDDKRMIESVIKQWIKKVKKMSIIIPNGLEIYVSNSFNAQCSMNFGSGKIFLVPEKMKYLNANPDAVQAPVAAKESNGNLEKFGVTTLMHESGHILHRQISGDFYKYRKLHIGDFGFKSGDIRPLTQEVSGYIVVSSAEFVAEVFAGLTSGKTYSEKVINMYKRFDGPYQNRIKKNKNERYFFF